MIVVTIIGRFIGLIKWLLSSSYRQKWRLKRKIIKDLKKADNEKNSIGNNNKDSIGSKSKVTGHFQPAKKPIKGMKKKKKKVKKIRISKKRPWK